MTKIWIVGCILCALLLLPVVVSADGVNATGNITVTSAPVGATIFLDNVNMGLVTPNTLSNVLNGSHTVVLQLTGYDAWSSTVLVAGDDHSVAGTLTATPTVTATTGNITITSYPAGAAIYRNNVDQNLVTPNTLLNVPNGTYVIALTLSGYQPWTQSITVAGNDQSINCTLVALVTTTNTTNVSVTNGSISFTSSPVSANVYINDVLKGYTPITVYNLTPDSYVVTIQKSGYLIYSQRFNVTSGNTTTVSATLTVEPTATPTLSATAPPTTATTATPIRTSTAKTYTPWPTATPTQKSPLPLAISLAALGIGLVVLRKK